MSIVSINSIISMPVAPGLHRIASEVPGIKKEVRLYLSLMQVSINRHMHDYFVDTDYMCAQWRAGSVV